MKQITLVIGGCKSGKSRHALALAEKIKDRRTFIATCEPFDMELKERVARHKAQRDGSWRTLDAPVHLAEAVSTCGSTSKILLIDCLTLWINNLLLISEDETKISKHISQLLDALSTVSCPVILVSNEVGTGIVPENRLARLFRDLAGVANQRVAEVADTVVYMVAGIPMIVKGKADI